MTMGRFYLHILSDGWTAGYTLTGISLKVLPAQLSQPNDEILHVHVG